MFFVDQLGPALTDQSGEALFNFVKSKLNSRKTVSADELRAAIAEFVRRDHSRISVDAALNYLTTRGRIAAQDTRTYRIAT